MFIFLPFRDVLNCLSSLIYFSVKTQVEEHLLILLSAQNILKQSLLLNLISHKNQQTNCKTKEKISQKL